MPETLTIHHQTLDYYNYYVMCNYVVEASKPVIQNGYMYEESGVLYCTSATQKGVYCYSYCLNNPLKYVDPSGQTWYDVRGERRFIDDGVDDDMAIKVSQMQFRRLERRFENDRNYEAYRNKLADINGYTTTHTIFGKFNEFSRNGNGTEVLPGIEVRWHRPNDAPGAARQDYSGFLGHLNYFWNGGIADGYVHNIDGQVIGVAQLMGTPPVPALRGGSMIKGLKTLQTGDNVLKPETLKALGLTQEQGKRAIEALKKDLRLRPNDHFKIRSDGSVIHPHTGFNYGTLFDYLP